MVSMNIYALIFRTLQLSGTKFKSRVISIVSLVPVEATYPEMVIVSLVISGSAGEIFSTVVGPSLSLTLRLLISLYCRKVPAIDIFSTLE